MRKGKKRSQSLGKRRTLPGAPPGSIIVDPNANDTTIRVMAFGNGGLLEKDISDVNEIIAIRNSYRNV